MSTMTIRVTSSATNAAGTSFGEQPDLGTPSYFDVQITDSNSSNLPNGTYDAYCLNPFLNITVSTNHSATTDDVNNNIDNYVAAGAVGADTAPITAEVISQINW